MCQDWGSRGGHSSGRKQKTSFSRAGRGQHTRSKMSDVYRVHQSGMYATEKNKTGIETWLGGGLESETLKRKIQSASLKWQHLSRDGKGGVGESCGYPEEGHSRKKEHLCKGPEAGW